MSRPLSHIWPRLSAVVAEHRPDLVPELEAFGGRPITELSSWFDEHFPRDGKWGCESMSVIPDMLRQQLENAK